MKQKNRPRAGPEDFLASQEANMISAANELRKLVSSQPPLELLGFLYSQVMLSQLRKSNDEDDGEEYKDVLNETQFLLEYVHAILSTTNATPREQLNEEEAHRIISCSEELRMASMMYAMGSSIKEKPVPSTVAPRAFGSNDADIEYQTKSNWILVRGNRHQPLEEEFYEYVLAPHDDLLNEVYGMDSSSIAREVQNYTDTLRLGHGKAIEIIQQQMEETQKLAEDKNYSQEEALREWHRDNAESALALSTAMKDLFYGGICNVSQHTLLPSLLLSDLAYKIGEDSEFFSDGDLCGTPFRTLPARKKPLLQIEDDYYAIDPSSFRDFGHRSILWNLITRRQDYKQTYEIRQKEMAERAFCDILAKHLPGATIYNEVYYKDPATNQWTEADTIVALDDILIVIEAKSGSLATIASPATNYERHRQAIQDLILKAYSQCDRAFRYFESNPNAPIFKKEAGKYAECGRIKIENYRVLLPIGLTVESFAPFAASCKAMPGVNPILQKHGFLSLSIDDLFVLRRILKTPGELFHYLEVRQAATLYDKVTLYDEMDHLGAYLSKNRIDMEFETQLQQEDLSMIVWDGMCEAIDNYFSGHDWESNPVPAQEFPPEILNLLSAIDNTRSTGWLAADSLLRNL